MNRKITLLALPAKWGGLGASGLSGVDRAGAPLASSPSSPSRCAKASAPNPQPARWRNSRRERTGRTWGSRLMVLLPLAWVQERGKSASIPVHELVRIQQRVAQIHQHAAIEPVHGTRRFGQR